MAYFDMSAKTETNAYLRTKVLTASPEELRLMLLDGAIKFLRQGREAMAKKDHEGTYNGMTRARNIVLELLNGVKPEPDPELYQRVTSLYTFMYTSLVEANMERDLVKCDKIVDLLEYERETWVMLMRKLVDERALGTAHENRVAAASVDSTVANVGNQYRPLSLQG